MYMFTVDYKFTFPSQQFPSYHQANLAYNYPVYGVLNNTFTCGNFYL